ncbi:MAG: hypothetical protein V2I34_02830 [Bacteroidales bacterium]|jgi:hypothetical protein|nr:hypothetical protein [Bacteroidales bacterium]
MASVSRKNEKPLPVQQPAGGCCRQAAAADRLLNPAGSTRSRNEDRLIIELLIN